MVLIPLTHNWWLGDLLDRGGFAEVFHGEAEDGSPVVIKLVPKEPGADRELLFVGLPVEAVNIVPILDHGEWEGKYFLVMPKAETSLEDHLQDRGGKLPEQDAIVVLADVAAALAAIESRVVHRDLKPRNILLYDGRWCLADFGVSRYAEASTSTNTHKYSMTLAYAAPEQFRGEHATSATDVYALGVTAFEILVGHVPFPGPRLEDFREQHLTQPLPAPPGVSNAVASLVIECMAKAPGARPRAENVLARLQSAGSTVSAASAALQEANRAVVEEQCREHALASSRAERDEARRALFAAGDDSFSRIVTTLRGRIFAAAPAAEISSTARRLVVRLGEGTLEIAPVESCPEGSLVRGGSRAQFDVVAHSAIVVYQAVRRDSEWRGRGHWYGTATPTKKESSGGTNSRSW